MSRLLIEVLGFSGEVQFGGSAVVMRTLGLYAQAHSLWTEEEEDTISNDEKLQRIAGQVTKDIVATARSYDRSIRYAALEQSLTEETVLE